MFLQQCFTHVSHDFKCQRVVEKRHLSIQGNSNFVVCRQPWLEEETFETEFYAKQIINKTYKTPHLHTFEISTEHANNMSHHVALTTDSRF